MANFKLTPLEKPEDDFQSCYILDCESKEIFNLAFNCHSWHLCKHHLQELKEFLNNNISSTNFFLKSYPSPNTKFVNCQICNSPDVFKLYFLQDNHIISWSFCTKHLDELKEFLNKNV